jgi:hypothetical protein
MTQQYYYRLHFYTSEDNAKSLRISDADFEVETASRNASINKILASTALNNANGTVAGFRKGQKVIETRTVLL